jgi:CRISPR-associated endoribonuclease Cas6
MPVAVVIPLEIPKARELPEYSGRALHALFYQWLAIGDYSLSLQVHDHQGICPFTVSPILRKAQDWKVRFTVLKDELWPVLKTGIESTARVELLRQPVNVKTDRLGVSQRTYSEILTTANPVQSMKFKFHSPTSFRSRGMHVPLPEPRRAFQSWLLRWNEFAPPEDRIDMSVLDLVENHVAVSAYNLHTRVADLGSNRKIIGFFGQVTFTVPEAGAIAATSLRALDALADYAQFCGTGHKTTQGLGLTERIR